MQSVLAMICLMAGTLALAKSTLERRAPRRWPLGILIGERYVQPRLGQIVLGLAIGALVLLCPFALILGLGWGQVRWAGPLAGQFLWLGLATAFVKFLWAAAEELIVRGALLPQIARRTNGWAGLILSALLFSAAHLERSGARTPDPLSLLVFFLDGIGFALAYVAMRNLWLATVWHATKNILVWLVFSEGSFQLTHGLWQASYSGPAFWVGAPNHAGCFDVLAAALAVTVLALIYRRQIVQGLEWVRGQ